MATHQVHRDPTAESHEQLESESYDASKFDDCATEIIARKTAAALLKRNYTLKEAATYLNVSTRTVERLIERKLLRRNKALRKILIPRTELDEFLTRTL